MEHLLIMCQDFSKYFLFRGAEKKASQVAFCLVLPSLSIAKLGG